MKNIYLQCIVHSCIIMINEHKNYYVEYIRKYHIFFKIYQKVYFYISYLNLLIKSNQSFNEFGFT